MNIVAHARNAKQRNGFPGRVPGMILGAVFALIPRSRKTTAACLVAAVGVLLFGVPAHADLTVTPITWDVVGLDHNRPLTSGPQYFPVGARVCSDVEVTGQITVKMEWGNVDVDYIFTRDGSLDELKFDGSELKFDASENVWCVDAYFEIELNRSPADPSSYAPFGKFRPYTITASYGTDPVFTASTPAGRQIYIAPLVSQNRNSTQQIRYCDPTAGGNCDPGLGGTGWVILGGGGTMALAVGNTYFIELTTKTSTAYEEIQSFLTLSNTIFQVLSVETKYGTRTAPETRVPDPNPSLWGDGCLWDSNPLSPNYNSCLSSGKVGGTVTTLYEIKIISGGGDSVGLEALIYDRSGGSFHYNTDFSRSPGEIKIADPTDAGFAKRFVPGTIGADGLATLRFTITNPNPVAVSGYKFVDTLPEGMEVVYQGDPPEEPIASNTCGGLIETGIIDGVGRHYIDFSDGVIGPNSSCTILVNVTVPFDADEENYPIELYNTADLYVGDAVATSAPAEATLEVLAETPPPCELLDTNGESLARWDFSGEQSATAPSPSYQKVTGIASAAASNFTPAPGTYSIAQAEWRFQTGTNRTEAEALTARAYVEFRVETTGVDSIDFGLTVWAQNSNAPQTIRLYYGPINGTLQQSTEYIVVQQSNKPVGNNFSVTNLTDLNTAGVTVFRIYFYNGSGNSPIRMDDVNIQGKGEICTTNINEPDPPSIIKAFSPDQIRVGATSTLTFTLTNPNAADVLTGVTFRDELPAGMTVVSDSFVNNCSIGSSWGLDGTNPDVLLFSDGTLAGNSFCTLTVNVISTAIGDNLNLSDPIDARETYPGNSAQDTLEVLPPPALPSIQKLFDPNPLLTPAGSTKLTFRITNNDPVLDIESVAFTDVLPLVDTVRMIPNADPFAYTNNGNCGGSHSFTWDSGNSRLTFDDGKILAGQVCEIYVDVKVPGVDVSGGPVLFPNETSTVSHIFNDIQYEGNTASATLLVDNPIPGISILKQVGLTNDPEGAWFTNLVVTPGTRIYYYIIVENTGEVELSLSAVTDENVSLTECTWTSPLPVASADNDYHITGCIVGVVEPWIVAQEGADIENTATATGTYNTTDYSDTSTATYHGIQPTAVTMGNVELASINVSDFLGGINAPALDMAGLLNLLRAWDPAAAAWLEGANRDSLLAALTAYLDPDGDGQVVVLRWETLEERGTIGFYAERREGGAWHRINSEMLPGLIASPMGAQYWLVNPGARPADGYQYRLIEVEARGTTREYGPFDLQVRD